jgi:hypothetical protein
MPFCSAWFYRGGGTSNLKKHTHFEIGTNSKQVCTGHVPSPTDQEQLFIIRYTTMNYRNTRAWTNSVAMLSDVI